jgi:hypothetical protein
MRECVCACMHASFEQQMKLCFLVPMYECETVLSIFLSEAHTVCVYFVVICTLFNSCKASCSMYVYTGAQRMYHLVFHVCILVVPCEERNASYQSVPFPVSLCWHTYSIHVYKDVCDRGAIVVLTSFFIHVKGGTRHAAKRP